MVTVTYIVWQMLGPGPDWQTSILNAEPKMLKQSQNALAEAGLFCADANWWRQEPMLSGRLMPAQALLMAYTALSAMGFEKSADCSSLQW